MLSLILACFLTTPSPIPPPKQKEVVIVQLVGLPGKEQRIKLSSGKKGDKPSFEEADCYFPEFIKTRAYNRRGNRNH